LETTKYKAWDHKVTTMRERERGMEQEEIERWCTYIGEKTKE